jgi:hypothetical protein
MKMPSLMSDGTEDNLTSPSVSEMMSAERKDTIVSLRLQRPPAWYGHVLHVQSGIGRNEGPGKGCDRAWVELSGKVDNKQTTDTMRTL